MDDREDLVYQAKLAEQAERYDGSKGAKEIGSTSVIWHEEGIQLKGRGGKAVRKRHRSFTDCIDAVRLCNRSGSTE